MLLDLLDAVMTKSLPRVFLHELKYNVFGVSVEAFLWKVKLGVLTDNHFVHEIVISAKILHFVGVVACNHFEYEESKPVEVDRLVVLLAKNYFWGYVLWSSTNSSCLKLLSYCRRCLSTW